MTEFLNYKKILQVCNQRNKMEITLKDFFNAFFLKKSKDFHKKQFFFSYFEIGSSTFLKFPIFWKEINILLGKTKRSSRESNVGFFI